MCAKTKDVIGVINTLWAAPHILLLLISRRRFEYVFGLWSGAEWPVGQVTYDFSYSGEMEGLVGLEHTPAHTRHLHMVD